MMRPCSEMWLAAHDYMFFWPEPLTLWPRGFRLDEKAGFDRVPEGILGALVGSGSEGGQSAHLAPNTNVIVAAPGGKLAQGRTSSVKRRRRKKQWGFRRDNPCGALCRTCSGGRVPGAPPGAVTGANEMLFTPRRVPSGICRTNKENSCCERRPRLICVYTEASSPYPFRRPRIIVAVAQD